MLGERLTRLRKSRKLTQQQVADMLHLSRGTYAQYEIDRRVPEYATLEKLADFFEVSIDYLVGREGVTQSEADEFKDMYQKLPEDEKKVIMGMMELILKKYEK